MARSTARPPSALEALAAAGWVPGVTFTCSTLPMGGGTVPFRIDADADRVLSPLRDDDLDLGGMEAVPIACAAAGGSSCLFADVRPRTPVFYYYDEGLHRIAIGVEAFIRTLVGTPRPASSAAAPGAAAASASPASPPRRAPSPGTRTETPAPDPAAAGYAAAVLLAGVAEDSRGRQMPATQCLKARTADFAVWWCDGAQGSKGRSTYSLVAVRDGKGFIEREQYDMVGGPPRPLLGEWPARAYVCQRNGSVRHRQTLPNDALRTPNLGMIVSTWLRTRLDPLLAGQVEFLPVEIRSESKRTVLHRDFFLIHPLVTLDAIDPVAAHARFHRDGSMDMGSIRNLSIDPAKVPPGVRIFQVARYGTPLWVVARAIIPDLLALPVPGMHLVPPKNYRTNVIMDLSRPH